MPKKELPKHLQILSIERWESLYPELPVHFELSKLIALSDLAFRILQKSPQLSSWLLNEEETQCREINPPIEENEMDLSQDKFFKLLRQYRQKYWLKVIWLDFIKENPISDSIKYISNLAESLIDCANKWAFFQTTKQCGTPFNKNGEPLHLEVLGMGKLGGGELNFSSDIDLIFTFPESVQTQGGRRPYEAQVFYTKVAQKIIAALDQVTEDGQVFRVDMRLRPFGESGPLVMSFSAMEDYYQDQGREWERYAMLKARLLGKQTPYWQDFYSMLRPFVYRRYIDFSVIDSLRKMKSMIAQEVRRKGLVNNIKLGAGGIREVEFIIQALQMVRGGREIKLQTPSLLNALEVLTNIDVINVKEQHILKDNYLFLRRVEQYLQAFDDQQTQTLPANSLDWQRLNVLLKSSSDELTQRTITKVTAHIREEFIKVIGDAPHTNGHTLEEYSYAWDECDCMSLEHLASSCDLIGWQGELERFQVTLTKIQMGARGRDILDKLIPVILDQMVQAKTSTSVFINVLAVIEKVASRTTYLELLYENQGALKQLLKLCSHSSWIARYIAKYPILLDELIDPAALYTPLLLEQYKSEARHYFLRIDENDLELQMESLRQFKQTQQLKIAAADATQVLDIKKVSDHLTALAEAIIEQAVNIAWQHMVKRYGSPTGADEAHKGFAIIAYGKAGGYELGYDSDLDLVFVHNSQGEQYTTGKKVISSRQFYLKLAQRLMHLFNTRTASGILYELDTRLRPEGNSGLLAINIESFFNYQQNEAWTWEHQALVRARMVFGETQLYQRFNVIRAEILRQQREPQTLKEDVIKMREKMRQHLAKDSDELFDLKQGYGGMADIEFITQYLVLNYSYSTPCLSEYTDNIRILDIAEKSGVINTQQQQDLTHTYCVLREYYHFNSLNKEGRCIAIGEIKKSAKNVRAIWEKIFW